MRKTDARHVRGIVGQLIKKWEDGAVKKETAVRQAWEKTVEEKTKAHTRAISLKKGIMVVAVDNSTLLYKLTLEKRKILNSFNENYTGRKKATDIRFRIGTNEEQ